VTVTSTAAGGSDTITASGTGLTTGTDAVQVQARGFSLNAGLVGINRTATGVITLNQPAPSSGATINLSVANTSLVTVSPATVIIAVAAATAAPLAVFMHALETSLGSFATELSPLKSQALIYVATLGLIALGRRRLRAFIEPW